MGWSSGSRVMQEVIVALNKANVPDDGRVTVYKALIPAFEDQDWDTQDECMGEDPAYDAALHELHPDWYDEDDE